MSQETRKDKRAPVSLRVRFKSATIDEFIEQYSTDISKGGIFIKSRQPMAVGTLLKFEFQLKDNSPLIQGVGRVVWKRDPDPAKPELAPGMGIKFIKMGPESRAVVDRIVGGRDGEDAYEEPKAEESTRVADVSQLMAKTMKEPSGAAPAPKPPAPAAAPKPKPAAAPEPAPVAAPPARVPPADTPTDVRALTAEFAPDDEPTEMGVGIPGKQVPATRGEAAIAEALKAVSKSADPTKREAEAPRPTPATTPTPAVESPRPAPAAAAPPAILVDRSPKKGGVSPLLFVVLLAALGGGAYWWFFLRGVGRNASEGREPDGDRGVVTAEDAGHAPVDAGHAKVAAVDAGHAAPVDEATATLAVKSTPVGATVFVDDTERGVTPLETKVVPGKALRIRVQMAGFAAFSREVTPMANAPTEVDAGQLRELLRVLVVSSDPEGADVTVDGRRRGRSPMRVELRHLADSIEVVLAKRGFRDYSTTVDAAGAWRQENDQLVFELNAALEEAAPAGPRGPRGPATAAPATAAPPPVTAAPATAAPPPTTAAPRTAAPPPATAAPPRTAIPDNPFG